MTFKTCSGCLETKSIDLFYREPRTKVGIRSACKACCLKRDGARRREEPTRAALARQRHEYRRSDPQRRSAWFKVWYRVKTGDLERKPCEICGSLQVHAHHDDYGRPLDVRWLCRAHHAEHHRSHP